MRGPLRPLLWRTSEGHISAASKQTFATRWRFSWMRSIRFCQMYFTLHLSKINVSAGILQTLSHVRKHYQIIGTVETDFLKRLESADDKSVSKFEQKKYIKSLHIITSRPSSDVHGFLRVLCFIMFYRKCMQMLQHLPARQLPKVSERS